MVAGLQNVNEKSISDSVGVVELKNDATIPLYPNYDFMFTRSFYPDLLAQIRRQRRSMLIGNPGVGMSWFQMYYLWRIINADTDPLPPDYNNNTEPPKVVIRQYAEDRMHVYFLETGDVHKTRSPLILDCFDPETSLYLFEPGSAITEPYFGGLSIPTLATVSPDNRRYKSFCNHGGLRYYMPVWKEQELVDAGGYMSREDKVPHDVLDLYTEESIRSRYSEYGGIMRDCLPTDRDYLIDLSQLQKIEIANADIDLLFRYPDLDTGKVSHMIKQYDVDIEGKYGKPFKRFSLGFINDSVVEKLKKQNKVKLIRRAIASLLFYEENIQNIKETEPAYMHVDKYLELVVGELLADGFRYIERTSKGIEYEEKAKRRKFKNVYNCPKVAAMEENVLYHPTNTNYSVVDLLYKDGNQVVGIKVTMDRSKVREVKKDTLKKLLDNLDIASESFKYVLCTTSMMGDDYTVKFEGDEERDYVVWKIDYNAYHSWLGIGLRYDN